MQNSGYRNQNGIIIPSAPHMGGHYEYRLPPPRYNELYMNEQTATNGYSVSGNGRTFDNRVHPIDDTRASGVRQSNTKGNTSTPTTFHQDRYSSSTSTTSSDSLVSVTNGASPCLKLSIIITITVLLLGTIGMAVAVGITFTKDGDDSNIDQQHLSSTTTAFPHNGLFDVKQDSSSSTCSNDEYTCNDDSCIPATYVCDVYWDCSSGEDESSCNCGSLFTCADGSCIYQAWVCDMENDCGDNSDEIGCDCSGHNCSSGICIPEKYICDGIPQCEDRSDEQNCNCSHLQRSCNDGTCILSTWFCDGTKDCSEGEDEDNSVCGVNCNPTTEFECQDHRKCIPTNQRCDAIYQCNDMSDETGCVKVKNNTSAVTLILGGITVPVCSTGWQSSWDDFTCAQMGYGTAVQSGTVPASSIPESVTGYAVAQGGTPSHSILQVLSYSSNCASGNILTLECSYDECGTRARQFLEPIGSPSKILHGYNAELGHWPWQVALEYYGQILCGATLIAANWIVTAAHCVDYDTAHPNRFSFRFGTTKSKKILSTMQTARAHSIYMHSNYNDKTLDNDIALIKLDASVSYTDYVKPACLPSTSEDFTSSVECYVTGWGGLDAKAEFYPEHLQEAKMSLINDTVCKADPYIAQYGLSDNIMLCAGYTHGYITVCSGDSGGPLVCRDTRNVWSLAGIVSWGPVTKDKKCMGISVFTEVPAYVNWIQNIMNSNP